MSVNVGIILYNSRIFIDERSGISYICNFCCDLCYKICKCGFKYILKNC